MTNQEKAEKAYKKSIKDGEEQPEITFLKAYGYSHDGMHITWYERGKTYKKYDKGLYEALKKEPIPVATFNGKVIPPYENKLFPKGEDKELDILSGFLNGLPATQIKAMCEAKKIDIKKLSKQEQIDALVAAK